VTHQNVKGKCPACGREYLYLGAEGHITCPGHDCPNPCAADELLNAGRDRATNPLHEQGDRMRTYTGDGVTTQLWAQIGEIGQSGTMYGRHETPAKTEPGGWMPLWILLDNEPTPYRRVCPNPATCPHTAHTED
jgi:Family of unknown function (DUF6085)